MIIMVITVGRSIPLQGQNGQINRTSDLGGCLKPDICRMCTVSSPFASRGEPTVSGAACSQETPSCPGGTPTITAVLTKPRPDMTVCTVTGTMNPATVSVFSDALAGREAMTTPIS
jgi:hypothetical protein